VRSPMRRGPLSAWVDAVATGRDPGPVPPVTPELAFEDDFQLALYLAQEVHFSDVPGFLPGLDGDGALLAFRTRAEDAFVARLRDEVPIGQRQPDVRAHIQHCVGAAAGPSLSRFAEQHATLPLLREIVKHRSAYQLKEADAHTMAIPHLRGDAKHLLARIQAGEYGADAPRQRRQAHAALFARTMIGLGLDPTLHAYLDELPASALAISTLVSTFGMSRRRRGALVGHLAAFELTSVEPMRRYGSALRRIGAPAETARFYDVHVLADAEHERLALDMAAAFVRDEPVLYGDVVLGAAAALLVERRFAETLLAGPVAAAAAMGAVIAA